MLKKLLKKKKQKSFPVVGCVERINSDSLEGWAIDKESRKKDLVLKIKNKIYNLDPQWSFRDDVQGIHGDKYEPSGFVCRLQEDVSSELRSIQNKEDVFVQVSEVDLEIICEFPLQVSDFKEDLETKLLDDLSFCCDEPVSDIRDKRGGVVGQIVTFNEFKITGWFLGTFFDENAKLTIRVNGQAHNIPVIVDLELQKGEQKVVFQIPIPGYLWMGTDKKNAQLELLINEVVLDADEFILSQSQTIAWTEEIAGLHEGKNKQYLSLISLEHIHHANIFALMNAESQKYYQLFSETMKLQNLKMTDNENVNFKEKGAVGLGTAVLWESLRSFNRRLLEGKKSSLDCAKDVCKKKSLKNGYLSDFVLSISPYFARRNELLNLRHLVMFDKYYGYSNSGDVWQCSSSVAFLVADAKFEKATEALWHIARNETTGWLNTESFYYSIRFSLEEHNFYDVDQKAREDFYYAFLGLLDSFNGDWFSRLHDKMLQLSMVDILKNSHLLSDYLRRDVMAAMIKHYGMSPDFWALVDDASIDCTGTILDRACNYWRAIYEFFSKGEQIGVDRGVVQSINFFRMNNNPEALIYLREFLLWTVSGAVDCDVFLGDLEGLVAIDSAEAARFAASPVVDECMKTAVVNLYRSEIFDTLRLKTERGTSVDHAILGEFVRNIRSCIEKNALAVPLDFKRWSLLNNWQSMFLNCDLIATCLFHEVVGSEEGLMHLDNSILSVIQESDSKFFLPAPVCSALACLGRIKGHAMIEPWLSDVMTKIRNKFGDIHQPLTMEPDFNYLTGPGWPTDTLVVIYSCRAYLDSRVKAIRETWVNDLKQRNIPYVFLVGDGDDRIHGDVLSLDVSDTYEDLPQKTLKLFEWLYHNSRAQYVIKIDDDCYMDVDRYFDSMSYRKYHYYGRVINRQVGMMDRAWHQSKSKTIDAKSSLDKSPEPSVYADGGGAYCLSRQAIYELLKNSRSLTGKRLIASSFMEDKLVGDLLAMSRIEPSNEDYECYQRRRTFGAARPVGMYENIFFPSSVTPTKVVHLDTDSDQLFASQTCKRNELWPAKIWPSYCGVAIDGGETNQLELITDINKVRDLLKNDFFIVAVMRNEMVILKYFLEHYRTMGVGTFIIADNCSDDGTREYLEQQPDVVLYSADTEYKNSNYGVSWQQAILANHCHGKWVLVADADEFLVCPEGSRKKLIDFISEAEDEGADCIHIEMIDMYPYGDLSDADFKNDSPFDVASWHDKEPLLEWRLGGGYYSNRPSCISALRHRIDKNAEPNAFTSQKYALFKYGPWIRLSQGIHDIASVTVGNSKAWFAHFKYHAGFKNKVMEEIRRKQHYDGAKEYKRYASMLSEAQGGFGMENLSEKFILNKVNY